MSLQNGKCDRCGKPATVMTGSFFDTAMVCMPCKDREEAHPAHKRAKEVEAQHVLAGNYNFPGISLPTDLKP